MRKQHSEQGQVLVLIILAIVGLMGFAALAVDVGNIFATRRHAQDAVDAASLAAAMAAARSKDYTAAALDLTSKNGFGMDMDPALNADKDTDVQVNHPPISGPYSTVANKNDYYQVIIRTKVRKIFSQFVFSGDEVVTVEAVTHSTKITTTTNGQALFSTGTNVCPGIKFNGNMTTIVKGGNIYSNSMDSGSCTSGIASGTSGGVQVIGGDVDLAGTWTGNAGFSVSPAPTTRVGVATVPEFPTPYCDKSDANKRYDNTEPLQPGYYPNGIRITSGNHTMDPGFYCLDGDFVANGGTLKSNVTATGNGVGIYMTATGGAVSLGGNVVLDLHAGSKVVDGAGNATMNGMLIYMDKANQNIISMAGGSGSTYSGTIYAPGPSNASNTEKCSITGSSGGMTVRSNIICYSINVSGSSSLTIDYRPEENAQIPPTLDVMQ